MIIRKTVKYIAIVSTIICYGLFIFNYVTNEEKTEFTTLFNTVWLAGIVSLISNASYAILISVEDFILSFLGLFGLIWFVPFFIDFDLGYGILSLILYLAVVILIHFRKY